jgi:ABC-type bacteriocin/lantibiotic exporter with double-glycine peptidase domain
MSKHRSTGWVRAAAVGLLAAVAAMGAAPLDVPFRRQATNGCGPASVAMLQRYWSAQNTGVAPPAESELHASLPVTESQGTLLVDMRRYLDSKGYYAFTIQADPTDLTRQISKGRVPIVALKNKAHADLHYVVVTGLDQHKVWLNDPAKRGPGSADRRKFEESWTRAGNWMLLAVPRRAE